MITPCPVCSVEETALPSTPRFFAAVLCTTHGGLRVLRRGHAAWVKLMLRYAIKENNTDLYPAALLADVCCLSSIHVHLCDVCLCLLMHMFACAYVCLCSCLFMFVFVYACGCSCSPEFFGNVNPFPVSAFCWARVTPTELLTCSCTRQQPDLK